MSCESYNKRAAQFHPSPYGPRGFLRSCVRIKKGMTKLFRHFQTTRHANVWEPVPPSWPVCEGPTLHEYAHDDDKRLVRKRTPSNEVWHYKGRKGKERLVLREFPNHQDPNDAWDRLYKGCKGQERLVKAVRSGDKWVTQYFKGPRGRERLVCVHDLLDSTNMYFKGPKDEERQVRSVSPHDNVHYYEGPRGEEYLTCAETPWAEFWMYDPPERGEPQGRLVRHLRQQLDGTVHHYMVPRNDRDWDYDRRVERTETTDGTVEHFLHCPSDGCYHHQRLAVTECYNGHVIYHDLPGQTCAKCRVRVVFRDGRIVGKAGLRWLKVRRWVAGRALVYYWQERTQMRLAAPGGAGRRADLEAFVTDFGALSVRGCGCE